MHFLERASELELHSEDSCVPGPPAGGSYTTPRLYGPLPQDHPLAQEQVFGLVAGIWTRDGARQLRVARRLDAGQVHVNGYGAGGGIELPFGGVKRSGHGRQKGFEALYEFSRLKTIAINHG